MITDSITGPQKRVWQKAGVTNATTTGFPPSSASVIVTSWNLGFGGTVESLSVTSLTSYKVSWALRGAGSLTVDSRSQKRTRTPQYACHRTQQ
jgi:hypothetical protein